MRVDDLIADSERTRDQNQNPREEVLEDVLEGESNRDSPDAECAHEIAGRKSGKRSRDSDERSDHDDGALSDSSHREAESPVRGVGARRPPDQGFHEPAQEVEEERDDERENEPRE